LTTEKLEVLSFGKTSQFGRQPRFANAGFPTEQHHTPLPERSGFDTFLQRSQFCAAPDEDRADNRLMKQDRH
jgi:hypothetical protein